MTGRDREKGSSRETDGRPFRRDEQGSGPGKKRTGPSRMELSSMPLDPIYAWGLVLEPVEVMMERTAAFVAELAEETRQRGEPFSDEELEERFLAFFDRLVEEGTLRRMPDAPPEMGRQILGPRRWLDAQRIRMQRFIDYWEEEASERLASCHEESDTP